MKNNITQNEKYIMRRRICSREKNITSIPNQKTHITSVKVFVIILGVFSFNLFCNGQSLRKDSSLIKNYAPVNCFKIKPLTNRAFDRFVTKLYGFTLLGNSAPATGLKLDVAKPSISVNGLIASNEEKTNLLSLQVSAGTFDNSISEIFSKDKINTEFKFALSGSFLYSNNSASFGKYETTKNNAICILRKGAIITYKEKINISDSLTILNALTDTSFAMSHTKDNLYKIAALSNMLNTDSINNITNSIMDNFGILKSIDLNKRLNDFYIAWMKPDTLISKKIAFIDKIKKHTQECNSAKDTLFDREIRLVKEYITKTNISWLSVSLPVSFNNYMFINSDSTSTSPKSNILLELRIATNWYRKFKEPHRFIYLAGGASVNRITTLSEMEKYSYKKSSDIKIIDTVNNSTQTFAKEETGIGYQGVFKNGWGANAFIECFLVPYEVPYLPGLYIKTAGSWDFTGIWRKQFKVPLTLGLIYSIVNSEKESKNLLTIIPYVSWSNVLNEYKSQTSNKTKALHEKFSVGLQIGLPISIGK